MGLRLTLAPFNESADPAHEPLPVLPHVGSDPAAPLLLSGTVRVAAQATPGTDAAAIARVRFVDVHLGLERELPPEAEVSRAVGEGDPRARWRGTNPPSAKDAPERTAGGPPQWVYRYDTALEFGRAVRIVAIAHDAAGTELARSAPSPLALLHNHGGYVALVAVNGKTGEEATAALRAPLAGLLALTVRAHRPDQLRALRNSPAQPFTERRASIAFTAFVDQVPVPRYEDGAYVPTWNRAEDLTILVDTRKYRNGARTITVLAEAVEPRPWNAYRGPTGAEEALPLALELGVTFDNGRTPLAVLPAYRDVWATPGERVSIPCELLHADGTRRAIGADEPLRMTIEGRVVEGDQVVSDGRLVASGDGRSVVTVRPTRGLDAFTRATFTLEGSPAAPGETMIRVRPRAVQPHFARDGGILEAYDARRSVFVANMFQLDVTDFADPKTGEARGAHEARLVERVRAAGINALNLGIFHNGVHMGGAAARDFGAWKQEADRMWAPRAAFIARTGFGVLASADGILRTRPEMKWTLRDVPWGLEAVTYTMRQLAETGHAIAVDVVDESSMVLGATPDPVQGWDFAQGDRLFPRDSVRRVASALRATTPRIPIAWPTLGAAHPLVAKWWQGEGSPSDYASVFWTTIRNGHAWYARPAMTRADMERTFRRFLVRLGAPRLGQVSAMGSYYHKLTDGDHYHPLHDAGAVPRLGTDPRLIPVMIWLAVAEGMAGVRVYAFDSRAMRAGRERATGFPSLDETQTGASPDVGRDRWEAMAAGLNAVHRFAPLVLQPNVHAPWLAPECFAGRKSGPAGELFTCANTSEYAVTVPLPADVRRALAGATRVRILGADVREDVLRAVPETVTLPPCEVWVLAARRGG